ncbi:predicted protein [Uncinocarpus reesii 1704]|uniref:Uncharacterized protein n=1 Tax=Uncinocarpus reesii (strain UAMH 1704) TaxID=336963 RepID=C4JG15_UNCRE|nr:uncharacterized protein UREG_01095 [Uncinocarpus reesii 1704]EEP76246.1 predicted protein [Uncinocarpus reesii 1704]
MTISGTRGLRRNEKEVIETAISPSYLRGRACRIFASSLRGRRLVSVYFDSRQPLTRYAMKSASLLFILCLVTGALAEEFAPKFPSARGACEVAWQLFAIHADTLAASRTKTKPKFIQWYFGDRTNFNEVTRFLHPHDTELPNIFPSGQKLDAPLDTILQQLIDARATGPLFYGRVFPGVSHPEFLRAFSTSIHDVAQKLDLSDKVEKHLHDNLHGSLKGIVDARKADSDYYLRRELHGAAKEHGKDIDLKLKEFKLADETLSTLDWDATLRGYKKENELDETGKWLEEQYNKYLTTGSPYELSMRVGHLKSIQDFKEALDIQMGVGCSRK